MKNTLTALLVILLIGLAVPARGITSIRARFRRGVL